MLEDTIECECVVHMPIDDRASDLPWDGAVLVPRNVGKITRSRHTAIGLQSHALHPCINIENRYDEARRQAGIGRMRRGRTPLKTGMRRLAGGRIPHSPHERPNKKARSAYNDENKNQADES